MLRIKSLLFAAVVLLASTAAMASNSNKEPKTYKQTFAQAMQSIDFSEYEIPQDRVYIDFMVNDDKEIIILATSNVSVDQLIKDKVNYIKVNEKELTPYQKYTIKVSIDRK